MCFLSVSFAHCFAFPRPLLTKLEGNCRCPVSELCKYIGTLHSLENHIPSCRTTHLRIKGLEAKLLDKNQALEEMYELVEERVTRAEESNEESEVINRMLVKKNCRLLEERKQFEGDRLRLSAKYDDDLKEAVFENSEVIRRLKEDRLDLTYRNEELSADLGLVEIDRDRKEKEIRRLEEEIIRLRGIVAQVEKVIHSTSFPPEDGARPIGQNPRTWIGPKSLVPRSSMPSRVRLKTSSHRPLPPKSRRPSPVLLVSVKREDVTTPSIEN